MNLIQRHFQIGLLSVIAFCLFVVRATAAPLAVGDAVPVFSVKDQFGKDLSTTNGSRFLLVATEMAPAKAASQKLAALGPGFLEQHGAAYLLDIHTMPGIARLFAFPKMRKYPQRIGLVDSPDTLANFAHQSGCVTIIGVNAVGQISSLAYWDPTKEAVADFLK